MINYSAKDRILKDRIDTYSETKAGEGHYTSWCASFVHWCFEQTYDYKKTNPSGWTFAFDWLPPDLFAIYGKNSKSYYDKNLKKTVTYDAGNGWADSESCEPFVGALIVYNISHITIIVGQTASKKEYVTLGGNQGGKKQ